MDHFEYRMSLAGWLHLGYFGLFIPFLVIRSRKRLVRPGQVLPNRLRHFRITAFEILMFTTISIAVAWVEWIPLFPRALPQFKGVIAGVALYAAAVAFMRPRWRRAVESRTRVVHFFMPANAVEQGWWIAISFLAGIGEEIVWRGVQATLLVRLTGSFVIAALLSSISFGLAHFVQGWKSAAIISVFALCGHSIVWLSGSLYVVMAVHVAYDLTAGFNYSRLGKELGYVPLPEPLEPGKLASSACIIA
jgi:membrane protease YdiL (CAAX protease family)